MILPPAKMKTQIKNILLDLDGTLYDYDLCHRAALEYVSRLAGKELSLDKNKFKELYKKSRSIIHRRLKGTAASHSRLLYFNELVFNYTKRPSFSIATRLEKRYWTAFYQSMHIYPGALQLLKKLRSRLMILALVTDMTTAIQFEKIRRLKLEHIFDVIVTSEEAGCEKPDPKIFEICLKRMNVSADSAIHIGDDFKRDIVGARAAGISSILFVPGNEKNCRSHVKIVRSFSELSKMLIPLP